jgi:mono/diheme cytochrome c family protein
MTDRSFACIVVLVAVGSTPLTAHRSPLTAQDTRAGRAVYQKWCAGCHGDTGAGDGPAAAYMLPRPRDFTGAIFKIRSTASGQLPMDADILRAIDEGLPGTAMPGWKDRLSERERRDVVAYVKTFSAFFQDTSQRAVPLTFSKEPGGAASAEALRVGRQFYDSIGCGKCHGTAGRGDGPSAPTLKTDAAEPIFAADLQQGWLFRGGASAADVYRRLRTGLDGTPMPSFSDLIDQQFLTDEQLWRLAQYVRSLSPKRVPEVRDVIHAPEIAGTLPRSPDDSAWGRVERYWFPLVGQVIQRPRWFAPAVAGVWVQAVHTRDSLALRLAWDDRSESPDTAWLEFEQRVLAHVANDDTAPPPPSPPPPGLWPDQVAVQFPRNIPAGMERPYFLMGTATDPVYQWRWTNMPRGAGAGAGLARGIGRFDAHGADRAPGAQAVFDNGQWRLVLTRALATADTANELQFEAGRAIPVAFFAWDGSSGEHDTRMAVSAWYFLALDQPTPPRVYLSPVVAMAVTLGLGMLVVARAQRRAKARA